MDTKSKNIKYSRGLKITAVILICLSLLGIVGSGVFFIYSQDELTSESYFDTYRFEREFATLVHNVVELNVVLKDVENIQNTFSEGDIPYYLSRLDKIETKLPNLVNFGYYIRNTESNDIYTNIDDYDPVKLIKEQENYVFFNENQSQSDNHYYEHDIKAMLKDTPYELYAAIIEPLKSGDIFYDDFNEYTQIKTMIPIAIAVAAICSVLLIGFLTYLIIVAGRREEGGQIHLRTIDKLYVDIYTIIVFIIAVISVVFTIEIIDYLDIVYGIIVFSILLIVDALIGLNYILSISRQIKNKQLIRNTLIYQLYKAIKKLAIMCFNGKIFKPWVVLLLLFYGLIDGFIIYLMSLTSGDFVFMILFLIFVAFNGAVIYLLMKSLRSLSDIMLIAKEISDGNLDYKLDTSNISVAFEGFAENIQNIQGGMKKAVNEAIKGEQMKTSLITNVSHDLKTPLTSIITYVDLLKKEEIKNKKANEYIEVLEDKSSRLKRLIEDLIEASKASTGNLDIKEEEIDLDELFSQAYGEFEEKFKEAKLDVRTNSDETKTIVKADGSHMWRIVENLLVNTIKYSLPNSRIYIDIDKTDSYGILTIKNISKNPLDITPEQLLERFIRGDESRSTEGNGLGLSIAKSLTKLQNGELNIEVDGDLFKVIVKVPLK